MEFIVKLIKWIILIIILVVIILLIVNYSSKTNKLKNQVKENNITLIDQNKNKEKEDSNDGLEPIQDESTQTTTQNTDQTVYSPDTASSGIIEVVIGSFILGIGAHYIYKRRNIKENS